MSLTASAYQLLDKLSDLMVGPVQGSLLARSTSGEVWVPQGLQAVLSTGRVVRVRYAKRVTTTPTAVPVRLVSLAPSFPAGNFAPVASGLVATWSSGVGASELVTVPATLYPTATTSGNFSFTARAQGLRVGSVVEAAELLDPADVFKAGANGGVSIIVLDPETRRASGSNNSAEGSAESRLQFFDVMWKIRVNVSTLAPAKERRVKARDLYDALTAMLQGAIIGDGEARVTGWKLIKRDAGVDSWELSLSTNLYTEGRVLQPEALVGLSPGEEISALVTIPGETGQPGPFAVSTLVELAHSFTAGFDSGFG